ncbi:MAG: SH3 domain-containing protein [bacterium]
MGVSFRNSKISIYGNTKGTEIVGTVKEDVVNIRSGPSTDYAVIGKMERGEKVNILSEEKWMVCYQV